MIAKVFKMAQYNRDWARYLLHKYVPGRPDELLTFRLRSGKSVTLKAETRFILNEIFLDRVYDVPGVNLADCKSILDIGANMGVFALYAADRAPRADIHCFEPSSKNSAILQKNIFDNKVRAKLYLLAVAPTCGTGYLSLTGTAQEYSLGAIGPSTEQVECVDLRKVFELTAVENFDFVKIDIEGAERDIINQCPDVLLSRIRALSLEWHHSWEELGALVERFRKMGFGAERTNHDRVLYLKARKPA